MTLADFLVSLAEDQEALGRFLEDPDGFLAGSRLDERQQKLLRSGDLTRIRHVVEYELDAPIEAMWIFVRVWRERGSESAD